MAEKLFNLYCDESTHLVNDHQPYLVLGYVQVAWPQLRQAKREIRAIKEKYGFKGEFKWTHVHEATLPMYRELVEYFFRSPLEFRAVVQDKSEIDEQKPGCGFNEVYFRLYYQLLNKDMVFNCNYNIYLDIKDTCSREKLEQLVDQLEYNGDIPHFQFIRSHESTLLQMADVLMGAVNYHLRLKSGHVEGKVRAKTELIRILLQRCACFHTLSYEDNNFTTLYLDLKKCR